MTVQRQSAQQGFTSEQVQFIMAFEICKQCRYIVSVCNLFVQQIAGGFDSKTIQILQQCMYDCDVQGKD